MINNLYIDMNGIIHLCARPTKPPYPTNISDIFTAIFNYITNIITIINPQSLLYIAIDGVAPRAKMNQQRMRRYRHGDAKSTSGYQFDTNTITPGTEFQKHWTEKWKVFLESLRFHNQTLKTTLKIILDDSAVPGEGEHKIINFIRKEHLSNWDEISHCIYGCDADWIMLALMTHEHSMYIIKEQFTFDKETKTINTADNELCFISIGKLRKYFQYEFKDILTNPSVMKGAVSFERIIDDFVFLCIWIGNDFLPGIPLIYINKGSIDELLSWYKHCLITRVFVDDYISDGQGRINLKNWFRYLELWSKVEKRKIKEITNAFHRDNESNEYIIEKYKQEYYTEKFKCQPGNLRGWKDKLCVFYIQGLTWVFQYYYNGVPSWDWFYPFHHTPFIYDLQDFDIECFYSKHSGFTALNDSLPWSPFEQLMSILPPFSSGALPKCLRKYMVDSDSEVIDWYPTKVQFENDENSGFFKNFSSITLIPFVEETRVKRIVHRIWSELSQDEKRRNSFGKVWRWTLNSYGITNWEEEEDNYDAKEKYKLVHRSFCWSVIREKEIDKNEWGDWTKYCGSEGIKRVKKVVEDKEEGESKGKKGQKELELKMFIGNKRGSDFHWDFDRSEWNSIWKDI